MFLAARYVRGYAPSGFLEGKTPYGKAVRLTILPKQRSSMYMIDGLLDLGSQSSGNQEQFPTSNLFADLFLDLRVRSQNDLQLDGRVLLGS